MRFACNCIGFLVVVGLALHVCSVPVHALSLPVQGKVQSSTETFAGTAVVHLSGDGSIKLLTSRGVNCEGVFGYVTRKEGRGTVMCEDGRKGSFGFVSAGFSGSGAGIIDNENFEFRIGK